MSKTKRFAIAAAVPLALMTVSVQAAPAPASAPAPAPSPANAVHIRGTVQRLAGQVLTVTAASGSLRVQLTPTAKVLIVVPSDRAHIKDGTFLGITSVPQAGGGQRAVEVHIFPESMRGAGEGSRAWDWPGAGKARSQVTSKMTNGTATRSRMTNGTVSSKLAPTSKMTNGTARRTANGSTLTVQYQTSAQTGSQSITIPPSIPIVTFVPGQLKDVKPGSHVFILATRGLNGTLAATRVQVGKNGLVPPM